MALSCNDDFPVKAPYIDNSVIAEKWRHGFTKTKAVHGVDNIGAYFSAYLADMPLETAQDFIRIFLRMLFMRLLFLMILVVASLKICEGC